MGRFNLINDEWISVIYAEDGRNELISLDRLLREANKIKTLAGDTKTQDFAVLRIILAILHTVYSRLDLEGKAYLYMELDEDFRQLADVDEDMGKNYERWLNKTWHDLWTRGAFTQIVIDYLQTNYDRFYLFDDKYPFMQVLSADIAADKIKQKTTTTIMGKSFNRTLSESDNKVALFAPKYASNFNKEILSADEVARWLITYHGYTGLADKTFFCGEKYRASKGWLFDLGGISLVGNNLFETLMLNLVLVNPLPEYTTRRQKPAWEYTSQEMLDFFLHDNIPDNLAQLYTTWSRAIYIDPEIDLGGPFSCQIVKLPDLEHKNQFLEPMTVWQYNKQGQNKDYFTPRKHRPNESLWRSFGLVAQPTSVPEEQRQPGVITWLNRNKQVVGDADITIMATGMQDDGKGFSWVPVDEVTDHLQINDYVLTDVQENNWVPRIVNLVEQTKKVIGENYRIFLSDIAEIRNIKEGARLGFINRELETLYFEIDEPFRQWLANIKPLDDKDQAVIAWRKALYDLVRMQAEVLFANASNRDLTGIEKEGGVMNIATAFNKFIYFLGKKLK